MSITVISSPLSRAVAQKAELRQQLAAQNILGVENINDNAIENTVAKELIAKSSKKGLRRDYLDAR
ncbi:MULTISPECIES: hypothetical protein [unclassified Pseudomonas]|uniref:hypothetical protein n=1 Tax=Pseudomonas TaxID=286 RepID=UPI0008772AD3|nr:MULTISPECIES: hypothetical protein [unclassified Pseudomonas]SCZ65493.1 hypothetical protein SAMN03159460_02271 [Pseudomonas sp. NFPP17]SDA67764.1 hypothetical protein SAMN03159464_03198 [Pseudomonas sp. NFPP15]SEK98576.1 hypothetical protein SAMN03159324_02451 [Pseudomonas sp. NFPP18]SFA59397.1 hypothetical protein SAMN03159320_02270 [Pseudomonas sp. NFPP13]SFT74503.1 hypothetical protein SAMN03159492_02451 [Pseudomonas sp. NFPP25]